MAPGIRSLVQQSQALIERVSKLFHATANKIERVNRIESNPNLNVATKKTHSQNLTSEIDKSFRVMQEALRKQRLEIARAYSATPKTDNNQRKMLFQTSKHLQEISRRLENQQALYKTHAPSHDPLGALFPKTPTTRPIMSAKTLEGFIKTAQKSWSAATNEMEKYAKQMKVPVNKIKEQVVDTMLQMRYQQVFNEKPKDLSVEAEPVSRKKMR